MTLHDDVTYLAEELTTITPADANTNPVVTDPLDVEYTVGYEGRIREIVLTITTDTPHIELHLLAGRVVGYHRGTEERAPVNNPRLLEELAGEYETTFREDMRGVQA